MRLQIYPLIRLLFYLKACLLLLSAGVIVTGCAGYRPALMINYTLEGREIPINKVVKGASPSWSADGKRLAFENQGIWIMDLDNGKQKRIAEEGSNPSWSPYGNRIAYVQNGIRIWDGSSLTHSLISPEGDNPCWFPDGESIAFGHEGIWRIALDGSGKTKLIDSGIPLSISHDGLFLLLEIWQPDHLTFNLGILDLSNFELRRIVEGTKGSFAPDGESIIYSYDGIWIYSMSKKDNARVVIDGYDPKWSPAGESIAFCSKEYIWLFDLPFRGTPQKTGFSDMETPQKTGFR